MVTIKSGKRVPGRLKFPWKELEERGITQENWLDHLDEMSDPEITAMLDTEPGWKKRLDEERKAQPSISDRKRAEGMKYFGI